MPIAPKGIAGRLLKTFGGPIRLVTLPSPEDAATAEGFRTLERFLNDALSVDDPTLGSPSSIPGVGTNPAYGELIAAGNFTTQTVTASFVKVALFNSDGISRGVTVSNSNDDLTILTAGDYLISFAGVIDYTLVSGSDIFFFEIFKNGSNILSNVVINRPLGTTSLVAGESFSMLATLAAGDVIDLRVAADDASNTPRIRFSLNFRFFVTRLDV